MTIWEKNLGRYIAKMILLIFVGGAGLYIISVTGFRGDNVVSNETTKSEEVPILDNLDKEIVVWGRVTDTETDKPIGVTVIIGGKWDFTDVDGRFRIKVEPGIHHLKITKTFQKVIERCDKCGSALSIVWDTRTLLETEIRVDSSNQRVDFNFKVKIPAEYKKGEGVK